MKWALLHDNMAELPKKNNKNDKKKSFRNQKQKYTREWQEQTLATSINTTNVLKKKKKRRDISEIMYLNYNKKSYFANNCTKSKN